MQKILSVLRAWLGWNGANAPQLTPPHGWLLPAASTVRGAQLRHAEAVSSVSHE